MTSTSRSASVSGRRTPLHQALQHCLAMVVGSLLTQLAQPKEGRMNYGILSRDHAIGAPARPIRKSPVGLVVAGSMFSGLVVALVLVVGPFGGAQEHVIMGTALLGWALGWALLAVLSIRCTDQPQRWAIVPAAVMALAGASLLILRPDASAMNLLGWIWPLALIALAVWMTVQAHRSLRSLARQLVLYPLFVGLVVAGVAGSYETIQEQVDRSATAMPGHLVDVGGRRLYLHCTGSGSPTVVLVSGLAGTSIYS